MYTVLNGIFLWRNYTVYSISLYMCVRTVSGSSVLEPLSVTLFVYVCVVLCVRCAILCTRLLCVRVHMHACVPADSWQSWEHGTSPPPQLVTCFVYRRGPD